MAGYLDQYGAGEEARNRIVARTIVITLAVLIFGTLGWYLLRNHRQEGVVRAFVADLRRGDYQAAYRDWGCTAQKPCQVYPLDKFLVDWGAKGADAPDLSVLTVADSESCNNGVLLTVNVNRTRTEKLWVDRGTNDGISFAPYPVCPHKNPFAIMLHRTIGQLRKPLLK